jgi:hypothetical protein
MGINLKNKMVNLSATLGLVFSFCIVFLLVIIMLYPYKLVDYNYDKFKIITPVVKAGSEVIFESEFYKNTDLGAMVERQLINSNIYYYSAVPANNPTGYNKRLITLVIPEYVEPGIYYVKSTIRYKVNFLREVVYVKDTEEFEVIK